MRLNCPVLFEARPGNCLGEDGELGQQREQLGVLRCPDCPGCCKQPRRCP